MKHGRQYYSILIETPPKFYLPTRLGSKDGGVAPPPENEVCKNPCYFVLVVACQLGISPIPKDNSPNLVGLTDKYK
jgi:hypothetical protein